MDLSIIIPTYNRNHHLFECLQSLEHNDAEFIVVDDGSSRPVEVSSNVHLIRHERNRGRAVAVNTGLRAASHDLVLVIDDDIYAAPDMVTRLADEFRVWNNQKLALVGRVVWDPDVKMTLTMRWMEESGPFREISKKRSGTLSHLVTTNTMMWRPFVLQSGGFDEEFMHPGLADVELGLRLKAGGLEVRLLSSAMGFHHKTLHVRDFIDRELKEGFAAVSLHGKVPEYLPQIADTRTLMQNAPSEREAVSAADEITKLEQADSNRLPSGVADLFMLLHRYYFLGGVQNGLNARNAARSASGMSATQNLYNQALRLEQAGELDEARRLFRLVRSRPESQFWAEAEYHLGVIAAVDASDQVARTHFTHCLALDPYHRLAHERLKRPAVFRELEANVFERVQAPSAARILFVVFGELDEVLNAFPVVGALRQRHRDAQIVWLTSPEYKSLAAASGVDEVVEFEPRGAIPWDWAIEQRFSHIFQPEVSANAEEWEAGVMHPMDFMAHKCRVPLLSRRTVLDPGRRARLEAESYLNEYGLTPQGYLTLSYQGQTRRLWPCHNLHKLPTAVGLPVVVFGNEEEGGIAGTIPCLGRSHEVITALIERSAFYVGPDFGVSWLAAATETPMGVFTSTVTATRRRPGFAEVVAMERGSLVVWDDESNDEIVAEQIASLVQLPVSPQTT